MKKFFTDYENIIYLENRNNLFLQLTVILEK